MRCKIGRCLLLVVAQLSPGAAQVDIDELSNPDAWINEIDLEGMSASASAPQGSWGASDGYLEIVLKKTAGEYNVPPQALSVEFYDGRGSATIGERLSSIPVTNLNPQDCQTNAVQGC
eukprot:SAG22_NODE_9534_length_584_cov_1.575258_1_plen_117_part_10